MDYKDIDCASGDFRNDRNGSSDDKWCGFELLQKAYSEF